MVWKIKRISDFSQCEIEKAESLMPPERKRELSRLRNDRKRLASVCAEALAREMVASYSGKSTEEIRFKKTALGAPYIENFSLHISISHSGECVSACVGETPVGIDIEQIREINVAAADKFCSESDKELLKADPLTRFYKIWTAKEAYFKMKGTGLLSPKEISYKDLAPSHFIEDGYIITVIE